jgi:hypothetical protein
MRPKLEYITVVVRKVYWKSDEHRYFYKETEYDIFPKTFMLETKPSDRSYSTHSKPVLYPKGRYLTLEGLTKKGKITKT